MASSSVSFLVSAVQNNNLAMTNCIFISPADAAKISFTADQPCYLQLTQDGIVYIVRTDDSVKPGELAFNKLQRTVSGLSAGQPVQVAHWYIQPEMNVNLSALRLEVDLLVKTKLALEEDALVEFVKQIFAHQVFCKNQEFCVDFKGNPLKFKVLAIEVAKVVADDKVENCGIIFPQTSITIEPPNPANKNLTLKKSSSAPRNNIFSPNFKFTNMGIGGLDDQLMDIMRRAFASHTFPPDLLNKLGIRHVKGLLLYGPPGTGKTLIARQIGKMLNGREPKIVNGPEILNKFVGQSEENIRKLFVDAEEDQAKNGDNADLHIIIFDEIDAICKQRGSVQSSAGVHDTVVNQLLSKMDGVNSLNNILVIGMTNRKELIDEALLRPGRFEVHVEIGLPNEAGRLQILKIHTRKMSENNFLGEDVNLPELAALTKNFSGAELEGLVKSAASYAFFGALDMSKGNVIPKADQIKPVGMEHFLRALEEVKPAFGVEEEELKKFLRGGFINYGDAFDELLNQCQSFIEQVRNSARTPMLSILLQGKPGCGKTALASFLAMNSKFPYVKLVSAEDMAGFTESDKVSRMVKIFRDAYKSPLSVVIVDEIESLLEYVPIGPRFSNICLQTLLVLLKKMPSHEGRKLLIIGTTSQPRLLSQMNFGSAFNFVLNVPQVSGAEEVKNVFEAMQVPIAPAELETIGAGMVRPIGMKQLLNVIAASSEGSDSPLTAEKFFKCLSRDSSHVVATSSFVDDE